MLTNTANKRHSLDTFYINNNETYNQLLTNSTNTMNCSSYLRPVEYASIRNALHENDDQYQQTKLTIHNLPKNHRQIPTSIFLNHHPQQQKKQFGSSHSAFRPVQPIGESKRASSEGHSSSNEHLMSSPTISSLSLSTCSLSDIKRTHLLKPRRLSCDLPISTLLNINSDSSARSICNPILTKRLQDFSRTMSDTLCDQFSEINLDAIEKDSLTQPVVNRNNEQIKEDFDIQHSLFTITKDYRSSRASFSVKRGDYVHVLKRVGRSCFLVRKQNNGETGFLPKILMVPATTTKVHTFLEMHGYRETVI